MKKKKTSNLKKEKYQKMTKIIFMFKKHQNFSFKERIIKSNDVKKFLLEK